MIEAVRICPRCKKEYKGYPALSRRDNKTEICSNCGVEEALEDFNKIFEGRTGNNAENNIRVCR